jgi:hypothetical protein
LKNRRNQKGKCFLKNTKSMKKCNYPDLWSYRLATFTVYLMAAITNNWSAISLISELTGNLCKSHINLHSSGCLRSKIFHSRSYRAMGVVWSTTSNGITKSQLKIISLKIFKLIVKADRPNFSASRQSPLWLTSMMSTVSIIWGQFLLFFMQNLPKKVAVE